MVDTRLRLLHLSDIHFLGSSDAAIARNQFLRREIERDLDRLATELGPLDAILIGGDLAYSGGSSQYREAEDWLHGICEMTRCKKSAILTVPGNHDVERSRLKQLHMSVHEQLRQCESAEITRRLEAFWATEEQYRELLFESISAYNEFARPYGCAVGADSPCWQQTLPLFGDLRLRVTGLTSTLVSGRGDSIDAQPLLVGACQVAKMTREPRLVDLVMCHHPPDWLRDAAELSPYLANAAIQVFGHKHEFDTDFDGRSVRIAAGAVHPDEREPEWEPRYNLIELGGNEDEPRLLDVEVYPRRWDGPQTRFVGPDGSVAAVSEPHHVPIVREEEPAARIDPTRAPGGGGGPPVPPAPEPEAAAEEAAAEEGIDLRDLVYRFLNLPFSVRVAIATELGLLDPGEFGENSEHAVFEEVFLRGRERGLLQDMHDKVRERGDGE